MTSKTNFFSMKPRLGGDLFKRVVYFTNSFYPFSDIPQIFRVQCFFLSGTFSGFQIFLDQIFPDIPQCD